MAVRSGTSRTTAGTVWRPASVAGGHAEVRRRAHYVTRSEGGRGAVREICDLILHAQGNYQSALAPYLA